MHNNNEKEEKKGGIFSGLSPASGGSSGFGSASGGGLFASKAGIVGLVLGSATVAAGIGVVYNFIGPSSKPVYSPELFQNSYYEEESSKASQERAQAKAAPTEASTLDMFKDQAKKDGLGGLASEAADTSDGSGKAGAPADAAAQPGASADAAAPGGAPGDNAASGAPQLHASSGFGGGSKLSGGGSSGTSIPKMQSGGGLSGGIGAQFAQMYKAPAGKSSAMTASAAKINGSTKYSVPNFNKKGAYGQAKFSSAMSKKATGYSNSAASAYTAGAAFDGGNNATGDVGNAGTGAGLGGAGVSNGSKLKANDPSLSTNDTKVPEVSNPTNESPWKSTEDRAMKFMMIAMGLIFIAKILSNFAKTNIVAYYALMALCALAIAAAGVVIACGIKMMSTYGQKMMGGVYILAGAVMIMMALSTMGTASQAATAGEVKAVPANGTTPAVAGQPAGCLHGETGFGNSIASFFSHFADLLKGTI